VGVVEGEVRDLSYVLEKESRVVGVEFSEEIGRKVYWHSTAHIMAKAVMELFEEVRLGIGPPIEEGFYYDFEVKGGIKEEDLEKIEKKMYEIIHQDLSFRREKVSKEEAIKIFKNQPYKLELIEELGEEVIIYWTGDFVDLCTGPHVVSTGRIKVIKLLELAGAYWRGSEDKPMLQRIYGISFPTQQELEGYLKKIEEARVRDHRRLGKKLGLYSMFDEVGAGLICWEPAGSIIRKEVEDFWKEEHKKRGYQLVYTPHIAKIGLWKTSGHYDYYEEMAKIDFGGEQYALKPMNCVYHILMYKKKRRSYRELPIRYAELGTVYRKERSGVLHGLVRVRGFTQDDAHIFCKKEEIKEEVKKVLNLALYMIGVFGFKEYKINLSVREEGGKYLGSDEEWNYAEEVLESSIKEVGLNYHRAKGEAVFYGPKIDIELVDALGRGWQCTTVQLDFNLPERFNLTYIGEDNKEHRVVMIHRAILGSLERFLGCLIEHYKGKFPLWLAPIQVMIVTITEKVVKYAEKVGERFLFCRTKLNVDNERLGVKIREGEEMGVPYIVVIGEKEESERVIRVRKRGEGDIGSFKVGEFVERIKKEIEEKR